MASIDDVAAYVTDHFDHSISTMKLQKLCYISQGWSLALRGVPLTDATFQAWRNGPVCRALFNQHRRTFSVSDWPSGDSGNLAEQEKLLIDAVLQNYGALTGLQLSELTHRPGTPWTTTRAQVGVAEGKPSTAVIPIEAIRDHYVSKLRTSTGA